MKNFFSFLWILMLPALATYAATEGKECKQALAPSSQVILLDAPKPAGAEWADQEIIGGFEKETVWPGMLALMREMYPEHDPKYFRTLLAVQEFLFLFNDKVVNQSNVLSFLSSLTHDPAAIDQIENEKFRPFVDEILKNSAVLKRFDAEVRHYPNQELIKENLPNLAAITQSSQERELEFSKGIDYSTVSAFVSNLNSVAQGKRLRVLKKSFKKIPYLTLEEALLMLSTLPEKDQAKGYKLLRTKIFVSLNRYSFKYVTYLNGSESVETAAGAILSHQVLNTKYEVFSKFSEELLYLLSIDKNTNALPLALGSDRTSARVMAPIKSGFLTLKRYAPGIFYVVMGISVASGGVTMVSHAIHQNNIEEARQEQIRAQRVSAPVNNLVTLIENMHSSKTVYDTTGAFLIQHPNLNSYELEYIFEHIKFAPCNCSDGPVHALEDSQRQFKAKVHVFLDDHYSIYNSADMARVLSQIDDIDLKDTITHEFVIRRSGVISLQNITNLQEYTKDRQSADKLILEYAQREFSRFSANQMVELANAVASTEVADQILSLPVTGSAPGH